jgi:hypothetical protein
LPQVAYTYEAVHLKNATFKYIDAVFTKFPNQRTVFNRHGVRIFVIQNGRLGAVDATAMLLQLTTSLTLFAMANFMVDMLMLYVLPLKKVYSSYKYQDTEDMSSRASVSSLHEAAQGAAGGGGRSGYPSGSIGGNNGEAHYVGSGETHYIAMGRGGDARSRPGRFSGDESDQTIISTGRH